MSPVLIQDKLTLIDDDSSLQFPVESCDVSIFEPSCNAHFSTEEVSKEAVFLDNYTPAQSVSDQNSVINSVTEHTVTVPVSNHNIFASEGNMFSSDIRHASSLFSECTSNIQDSIQVWEPLWGKFHAARCLNCKDCSGNEGFVSK